MVRRNAVGDGRVVDGAVVEVGLAHRVGGGEVAVLPGLSVALVLVVHEPDGPLRLTQVGPLASEPAGACWVSLTTTPLIVTLPVFWTTKV